MLSHPLANLALKFTAPEYFSLLVMGLISAVVLAHGSPFKAIAMILIGILTGLVGVDVNTGRSAAHVWPPGIPDIADGMDFVPVVVGLFGIGEVAATLEVPQDRSILSGKIKNLMPTGPDLKAAFPAILRGTAVGTILGILPGGRGPASLCGLRSREEDRPRSVAVRQGRDRGGGVSGIGEQRGRRPVSSRF